MGDYNNDGFEDLFLTYYGQNRLYRNNGDGTFTDVTAKAGLLHPTTRYSTGCTFVDYNRDGLLDLFVSNYLEIDLATAPKPSLDVPNCNYEGVAVICGPQGLPKAQHYLYRNNGDGTFTDVSKESGVAALRGSYGLTAVSIDADEDGWPDIFVACDIDALAAADEQPRRHLSRGGSACAAWRSAAKASEMGGMGAGVGDYNLDGHTDIVKTHYYNQATGLYRNDGKGNFDDVTDRGRAEQGDPLRLLRRGHRGLRQRWLPRHSAHHRHRLSRRLARVSPRFPARSPRILFRNQGDGTFVEMGAEAGPGIDARALQPRRGLWRLRQRRRHGRADHERERAALAAAQRRAAGQPLDQDSPGRHKEQPQRHRRARAGALRRQGAGAGGDEPDPAFFLPTIRGCTSAWARRPMRILRSIGRPGWSRL